MRCCGGSSAFGIVGLDLLDEYMVPNPVRAKAGLVPVGAASCEAWLAHLRRVLSIIGPSRERAAMVALHTAKRTAVTWAGTSDTFTDRQLEVLGHHRSAGVGTTVRAYNQTELAAPFRLYAQLLEKLATGEFDPDAGLCQEWQVPGWADDEPGDEASEGEEAVAPNGEQCAVEEAGEDDFE